MIVSKKLSKLKEISHGFFNNKGGCSTGIYRSLNCGPGSNDNKTQVIKNLRIVKKKSIKIPKIFFYYIKYIVISLFILIKKINLDQNQKQTQ